MFWESKEERESSMESCKVMFDSILREYPDHILPPWSQVVANYPKEDPYGLSVDLWRELLNYELWLIRLYPRPFHWFSDANVEWLETQLTLTSDSDYRLTREHIVKYLVKMVESLPDVNIKNLVTPEDDWRSLALLFNMGWVMQLLRKFIDVVSQGKLSPHDVENLALLSQNLKKLNPDYEIQDYQANVDEDEDDVVNLLFGKAASHTPSLQPN